MAQAQLERRVGEGGIDITELHRIGGALEPDDGAEGPAPVSGVGALAQAEPLALGAKREPDLVPEPQ